MYRCRSISDRHDIFLEVVSHKSASKCTVVLFNTLFVGVVVGVSIHERVVKYWDQVTMFVNWNWEDVKKHGGSCDGCCLCYVRRHFLWTRSISKDKRARVDPRKGVHYWQRYGLFIFFLISRNLWIISRNKCQLGCALCWVEKIFSM